MILDYIRTRLRKIIGDQHGNVLMMFGFALVPMMFSTGMVIDYSRAAKMQTKLNAIADAAALSAVTTPMMKKDKDYARQQAINLFVGQASALPLVIFNTSDLNVTVTESAATGVDRSVTVSYSAKSTNLFGRILGWTTLNLSGTAAANAKTAPNIDFYVLVDTSPSMALPATTAGLTAMTNTTKGYGQGGGLGCAFACHQSSTTSGDPGGTPKVSGNYVDNYYVAKTLLGLTLRMDLVQQAVSDLTTVAVSSAAQNNAIYRMALSSFNVGYNPIVALPTAPATVKAQANNLQVLTVCRNNQYICNVNDNDAHTNFTSAFTGALLNMPLISGNGGNQIGDTPQAMLFLITDGMRDENNSGRKIGPIPTAQCDTIKARGIKIAVLYTEYLYESANDSWSISNVRTPYLAAPEKISPPLINCASPGLYYKVTTNDDISQSLAALFQKAIATAHLTQ
ncbi:MAG TPA: pilus assembly protein TadG-related protein [Sphingobium sp.]